MEAIQSFSLDYFVAIKALHVLSATLWAFATAGAMLCYVMPAMNQLASQPDNHELKRRAEWVLERFDGVALLEHIALFFLLFTGVLLYSTGIADFTNGWFAAKMAIVLGFFIPLEIYDVWLTHVKAPRMTRAKDTDPVAYDAFRRYYFRYLKGLGLPIILTVPTVLILALTKPF